MKRVYAQDTTVNAHQSQGEVRSMLHEVGATRYAVMEHDGQVDIMFEINQTAYRISRPELPEIKGKSIPQRERAAWRALVLLIKAKKVAIDQGITTVEREFMADTLTRDGSLLIEHREALLAANYGTDGPPRLGYTPSGDS